MISTGHPTARTARADRRARSAPGAGPAAPAGIVLAASLTVLLGLAALVTVVRPVRPDGLVLALTVVGLAGARARWLTALAVGGLAWLFYVGFVVNVGAGHAGDLAVHSGGEAAALPALVGTALAASALAGLRARAQARAQARAGTAAADGPLIPAQRRRGHDQLGR